MTRIGRPRSALTESSALEILFWWTPDAEVDIIVGPTGIVTKEQPVAELARRPAPFPSSDQVFSGYSIVLPTSSNAVSSAMTMRLTDLCATTATPERLLGGGVLNSTDVVLGAPPLVESQFSEAAALAGAECFEEGIESRFSSALSMLIHANGIAAIAAVENFLRSPSSSIEIAVEATEWLGEVDHPASQRYRRTLLEWLLDSTSTRLRHGAAAGLASMDNPASLPALHQAYDRESNQRLRTFIKLVLDQLEQTRACLNS